jgi:hypothetical protein
MTGQAEALRYAVRLPVPAKYLGQISLVIATCVVGREGIRAYHGRRGERLIASAKPTEDLNAVQIGHEQARPSCQVVTSGVDTSNFEFILPVVFAMLVHSVLYLSGVFMFVLNLAVFNKYYNMLSNFKGLFFYGNHLF